LAANVTLGLVAGCSFRQMVEAMGAGFLADFNCETRCAKNARVRRVFKSVVMSIGFHPGSARSWLPSWLANRNNGQSTRPVEFISTVFI
jgi:hypothetical protein